jgi:hypothetical protein
MLFVILVNICRVDQLIFTVQCELSKLQIGLVKIFHFSVKTAKTGSFLWKTESLGRFTADFSPINQYKFKFGLDCTNSSSFTDFHRFTGGKPLPVGNGFFFLKRFCKPRWKTDVRVMPKLAECGARVCQ